MKIGASSSMAPAITVAAFEVAVSAKILPTIKVGTVDVDSMPSIPPGPSSGDQAPKLPAEGEMREGKKKKKAITKTPHKAHFIGSSNAHPHQEGTPSGGGGRESLGGSSSREEERKKEAEIKVAELEARMAKSISKVMIRAVEEFKASSKMRNLNVKFSQQAFIKDFELCKGRVVRKFLKLNLSFLEEEEAIDGEAEPSTAAVDPSPTGAVVEPFELTIEEPEPSEPPVELALESAATAGAPSSPTAFLSEVGSF
ncbi:hypothetical protein COCNU_scaffold002990G000030 [Cocos nucifera]|nr:hypothetical protein [Cocos nucifera]